MDPSAALEQRIHELTQRLEHRYDRITSCHVVVEAPAGGQSHHGAFRVRVDLSLPGSVIHASNAPIKLDEHCDAYVALRDAFESAKRQLTDVVTLQ
jgi:ribosome-associated translation inhibitor RaiA